jgi:hypothetical protein
MAWTPTFALILVVATVEIHLLLYLLLSGWSARGNFLLFQGFYDFWTSGGGLGRGLPFEVMKLNVLVALYAWVSSRGCPARLHRFALVGAGLLLVALQLGLFVSYEIAEPRFVLTLLEP